MTDAGPYWGNSNLPQGQRRTCSFCSQEWDDNRPTHVCGNQVVAYDDLAGLVRACDELRAENEVLRADAGKLSIDWGVAIEEIERLRAVLRKWRPSIERGRRWYEQIGNEREARGFEAMLADFDSA